MLKSRGGQFSFVSYEYSVRVEHLTPLFDQIRTFLSLYGVDITDVDMKSRFRIEPTKSFPFTIMYASAEVNGSSDSFITFNLEIVASPTKHVTSMNCVSISPQALLNFLQGEFVTDPYLGRMQEYENA